MKRLTEILHRVHTPSILDIGTGSGQFVHLMTQACDHYQSIVGIDVQLKSIENARKHFKDGRISFVNDSVYNVNEIFDIVCLSNSLHHFDDTNKILNQMLNLVKPGGLIVINEMIKDNQTAQQMTHVGLHHFWAQVDRLNGIVHNETFDQSEILNQVYIKGTKIVDSWAFEFEEEQVFKEEDYVMLKNSISNSLKRIEDHDSYDDLLKTGQILEDRIDKIGFALATEFMVILKKC